MKIKESSVVQSVGTKAQDGKMGWIMITKTTMGVIFQFTKFSFIDFVLTDRKNLQVNGQNWPVGNLPVIIFCSQPQEMSLPKQLNV